MHLWTILVGIGLCSELGRPAEEQAIHHHEDQLAVESTADDDADLLDGLENKPEPVDPGVAPTADTPPMPAASASTAEDDSNIVPEQVDVETFNTVVSRLEIVEIDPNEPGDPLVDPEETWKLTSKATKNYASDSCGARIEKSAPDVTGAKYVINNDFDKYAKAPIDKKFGFTVELCEEIQIQRLFISVNELFASRPSSFFVQATDKAKSEWHGLGTFSIDANERSNLLEKSFNVTMTQQYFKFVKYEMVQHSGDEPFSVLTSFKVFGFATGAQKYDEYDDDEDPQSEDSHSGSIGNTIFDAVKKALTGGPVKADPLKADLVVHRDLLPLFPRCEWNGLVHRICNNGCRVYADAAFNLPPPRLTFVRPPVEAPTTRGHENNKSEQLVQSPKIDPNAQKHSQTALKVEAIPSSGILKQVAKLEKNLTWMGSYLETLSQTYKRQMDDVRVSFEKTASRLTKSEVATQQTQENVDRLLELVKFLFTEIDRLDTTLEKTIIAASVVIALQVLTVLIVCNSRGNNRLLKRIEENQMAIDILRELVNTSSAQKRDRRSQRSSDRKSSDSHMNSKARGKKKSKIPKIGTQ